MAMRGFGLTFDLRTGGMRDWYFDDAGKKRWVSNDRLVEPAKPRKLMHFVDVGAGSGDYKNNAHFVCGHCGHDDGWSLCSDTEVRRGIPCPMCLAPDSPDSGSESAHPAAQEGE